MNEQFALYGQTLSNLITCYIDGENIVQRDYVGNQQIIGKTNAAYNELQTTTQQYYDKLVELGVITPPKSPEDMMKEMQGTMKDMAGIIADLSAQVKELKEHGHEQCHCSCEQNVPERKPQRRGGASQKSDTGDAGQPGRGAGDSGKAGAE